MRVTMLGPFAVQPKGTVRARLLPLAQALAAGGHTVRVVLPPYDYPAHSGAHWYEQGCKVENVTLPRSTSPARHLLLSWRMACRAVRPPVDIIHLFKPKGYGGIACRLLLLLPRRLRPAILVDSDDWEGAGGWNDIADYAASWRRFFAWQEQDLLRAADGVTVASHALQELATILRGAPDRVWRVPNGVNVIPSLPALPKNHPLVLLFSRLHDADPSVVVPALAAIHAAHPDVSFCIAGAVLHDERTAWRRRIADAGLNGHTCWLDWIPPEELPALFARTTVALVPLADSLVNRCRCSAKLALLLAAGVPVVASAVGENVSYVRDGLDGLLVPAGDVTALATATLALLADAGLRARLAETARRRLGETFAWPLLARQVADAYTGCYA